MNRLERLIAISRKKSRVVAGLMSGTSVDAIDAVLVRIAGDGHTKAVMEKLRFDSFPFPGDIRTRVKTLFDPNKAHIDEICQLDFIVGEMFAGAVNKLIEDAGMKNDEVDLIAAPGQTIWHHPRPVTAEWLDQPIATRGTLAIGQSAVIAERTGILTIGDLRVRDVAAGGHGAPLVAYFDWAQLRHPQRARCMQNIGGIANVTYVPPGAKIDDVFAFDTGPGNMVIDELVFLLSDAQESFDRDGARAARGTVREDVLAWALSEPYFDLDPPKTTGRERFGRQFARRMIEKFFDAAPDDLVATATTLTIESIVRAYERWIFPRGNVDDVIVAGGGAKNPVLLRMLRERLPQCGVEVYEHLEAKEAMAMALIANDSLLGLNTNCATGGQPTILGKICL
ncbi:MAG TPA: anhydro-N-acetylmuramic acid kinase [Thermoanaerobaculia bacterium]|nr:anhydro-N-acetylmuramic acid kinase [Thermoanaerobaculia bacterium]